MARRTRAVVWAIALGGAGCSLTTSFDGLTGGAKGGDDAGAETGKGPEASTLSDAAADAPLDAALDASDALSDAAFDAATDAPDAASPCTTTALFCDDFDGRTDVQGPWTSVTAGAGANVSLVTSPFVSPPQAVFIDSPGSSGTEDDTLLSTKLAVAQLTGGHIHVEFDIHLSIDFSAFGSNADADYAGLFEIDYDATAGFITSLAMGQSGVSATIATVSGGVKSSKGYSLLFPGLDKWVHVALDVVLAASGGQVVVELDGVKALDQENLALPTGPTSLLLNLGVGNNGTSPASHVYYDNFVVR